MSNAWTTRGFEAFAAGICGNAGQNLYVSRAGVLQRIHQYDFNHDGYLDLIICNSQNHWEKPPAYVYTDPFGAPARLDLPSDGAKAGLIADLNGDGYDDLVLGMWYNGIRKDLNAFIYYGSPDGWGERRQQMLPAPSCTSVAAGDFNGDGRPDLAFLCDGKVRIFYQTELGFEPKRFKDLDLEGEQLAADDLDGDGFADLLVRDKTSQVTIYWGATDGIDAARSTAIPISGAEPTASGEADGAAPKYAEYVEDAALLVKIIRLAGAPYVFVPGPESVALVPIGPGGQCGAALHLACPQALSIAAGDFNGDGQADLAVACRQPQGDGECSWIYWGGQNGFTEENRTKLPTRRACDVAAGDLDGDGYDDIVLCQCHTDDSFTTESLVFRGGPAGAAETPVRLVSEDARRVLLGRPAGGASLSIVFVNYFARGLMGNVNAYIYFGGPGGFSPQDRREVPAWGAVEAVCCDANDDGYVDLLLANASENSVSRDPGSYLVLNGPDGFADMPALSFPTKHAHGVCCADINRNGYLDAIFCGFDNPELLVFYGDAAGGFDTEHPARIRLEHEGFVYNEPGWIYLADLNNDGWLDLVVPQISYDRSFILWGGPGGFSMERCQVLSVVRAGCVRAADLTGNGYLDLIVGGHMPDLHGPHDSFVYIYWNGPRGLREDNRTILPAKTINAMSIADFNNDGLLDIFICSYHDVHERDVDSYIYWNRAGRGFSADDRTRMFTHSASGCVAGDFNGNGWIDLAIAYHKVWGDHVGYSAVWWNGPQGFSEDRVTTLPTTGPHGMAAVGLGSIVDRGPEEYYVSSPFELPACTAVTGIAWEADIPAKTWVRAQLRVATSRETLDLAPWMGQYGPGSWYERGDAVHGSAQAGRWVQYRLALGARDSCGTPRVTGVCVSYE